jgi:hypothetical protein
MRNLWRGQDVSKAEPLGRCVFQCLKDQYDAVATPIPPHLAALVKQLKTQEPG